MRRTSPDDPTKRLAVVEALLKLLPVGALGHRPDPALRALLIGERKRLKWIVKQALSPAELKTAFQGLKRTLYPYQREGVERFLAAGRLLLADDMGLGKTAQAIASCDVLWRTRRIRRGLIIAPASLKPQWAREWAAFSDLPVRVVDGTPAERQAIYDSRRSGFLIINYEQLLRDLEMVRRWGPDLVVLDEAQRIKNWATKTALSVKGLTPPLSPGPDRHADGEPDRGAGLDRRVGRRHGPGAQVAPEPAAFRLRATVATRSAACATSTPSASGSGRAWCAGSARTCSTSSPRGPTSACPSR